MKQKTMDVMRPVLEAYARYEGSKKAFCQEQSITMHTLDYWRRKFKGQHTKASAFVALEVSDTCAGRVIELRYPNGVRAVVPLEVPAQVLQTLITLAG